MLALLSENSFQMLIPMFLHEICKLNVHEHRKDAHEVALTVQLLWHSARNGVFVVLVDGQQAFAYFPAMTSGVKYQWETEHRKPTTLHGRFSQQFSKSTLGLM